ncbi:MAG: bifunctional proline dehydrogenase/L-glutamate gamma-semialdehyde dehydrogenase [Candidatus Protochlamydia sp.]|nr:bifunctional proline dehydrogenase/L-glutamate gamma-semialdehyde dehydrogenase [Candidatus Protochlamydia sp.]
MTLSPLLEQAAMQIQSVKEKKLSSTDRTEAAISLAAILLEESNRIQTSSEKNQQARLAGLMKDPLGKVFAAAVTDQCFRSASISRSADQILYLINKYGIPPHISTDSKRTLKIVRTMGKALSFLVVPFTNAFLRKETSRVILPGEEKTLDAHLKKRKSEGVNINLNHLGEAILGEEEAERRLQIYLNDLANPLVECISIKISTLYSQISLLAYEETVQILGERLRKLYRAAIKHPYKNFKGKWAPKFVNLDMEEYRDLHLTASLFREVLDEPEFQGLGAGIVLQSYLPDAFLLQQELTVWALRRCAQGGSPIKIRLVKGANLAMEKVEASLRMWPQAPFDDKVKVDANYKRMVAYACEKEHARAVHVGIGSHNLFDISYALLLRSENEVEKEVGFEMLEGMADATRRAVQSLSGDMLLYCPAAKKEEFQNAVAYLIRRLDENTAPENFLRAAFDLKPGTIEWEEQARRFRESAAMQKQVPFLPNRSQNRLSDNFKLNNYFKNIADTDWALPQNRKWAEKILREWKEKEHTSIPLIINGYAYDSGKKGKGIDPSFPVETLYTYALADLDHIDLALNAAKEAEPKWLAVSTRERFDLLGKIAEGLMQKRGDLIGAMVADVGKPVQEADIEVSEAVDFANYYRNNLLEWSQVSGMQWIPKGTILVAPPWNFPCSIPCGGILASLAAGNCVIFKPAPEATLIGWHLAQIFWQAGISRQVLQFIACEEGTAGNALIQDPRLSAVILTGGTETAKHFLQLKPDLDLIAETGGKNTMVITALSDRDLAIKDLIQSAFGYAGQKCSACSLAILEAEVYDDPHFLRQLRNAASSLKVSSPWSLNAKVNPMIRLPQGALLRGLTKLEEGESWLLKPEEDSQNPHLWTPGIKLGVRSGSFTFQTELFGPVLGVVRADNFEHALKLMNQTPYGLTAGIHSLDEREQKRWAAEIEAGNCYINRTITGAVVERQPFGGYKDSSFGKGYKAGGPNYLLQFMQAVQISLPEEKVEIKGELSAFYLSVNEQNLLSGPEQTIWQASVHSYVFYWENYFSKTFDPSLVVGQDNLHRYLPHSQLLLRVEKEDSLVDIVRVIAASAVCTTPLEVSVEDEILYQKIMKLRLPPFAYLTYEKEAQLVERIAQGKIKRARLCGKVTQALIEALANAGCRLNRGAVMANGRVELLQMLREASISSDYHRYGNLGDREQETRAPLIGADEVRNDESV